MRADFLDEVVWRLVSALLADPALVQADLDRRLAELRTANPATATRSRIELDLILVATSCTAASRPGGLGAGVEGGRGQTEHEPDVIVWALRQPAVGPIYRASPGQRQHPAGSPASSGPRGYNSNHPTRRNPLLQRFAVGCSAAMSGVSAICPLLR